MVKQDELRMIKYLLGNTNLSMEVRNEPETKTFTLNIGTPPGHRFIYNWQIRQPAQNANAILQLAYADVADFVSSTGAGATFKDVTEIEKLLADVNLHVNTSRTQFTTVQKSENEHWWKIKKVGARSSPKC